MTITLVVSRLRIRIIHCGLRKKRLKKVDIHALRIVPREEKMFFHSHNTLTLTSNQILNRKMSFRAVQFVRDRTRIDIKKF